MADTAKHGRRAKADVSEGDDRPPVQKGWSEKPVNEKEAFNLPTLDAGVDESVANAPRQEEDLSREVAAAPTEYHSAMPKLSELSANNRWATQLRPTGIDLSVLIATLSQTLDEEDVPWNPNSLLVQLNSELLDAVDKKESDPLSPTTTGTKDAAAVDPERRRRRDGPASPTKSEVESPKAASKSSSDLKKEVSGRPRESSSKDKEKEKEKEKRK